jgi:hypothetical protein
MKKNIFYLSILIVFTSGISITPNMIGVDLYWYYIMIPIYVIYRTLINKLKINIFNFFLFFIFYTLLVLNSIFHNTFNFTIKQLLIGSFSYLFFKLFFEDYDLEDIIKGYFKVSKFYIVIGFIQFLICLLGFCDLFEQIFFFNNFNNISYRLTSFDLEPSFVCYALTPFAFVSIVNLIEKKSIHINTKWSILGIIAYMLTVSPMAILGIIITLFLNYFRRVNLFKLVNVLPFIIILIVTSIIIYSNIPVIKMKIDDTYETFIGEKELYEVNLSSYAFISNYRVAINSVKENPIFGIGLGAHEINYDRYKTIDFIRDELNKKDANSLFLRIISELGLFGIILFLFFLFKYRIYKCYDLDLWVINNGIFVCFLLRLIRNGNYTIGGMLFFVLLYYYTYVRSKKSTN